ncbi:thioredoxin family protein [Algoriphagus sp. CAU 1675]|uniref:thioredoxin family protein n=1 Tax=Algoriphagus sp. CAU 1675 TaxID=3032597 RepID=UPI0023DA28F9|nr:thioredoxin family protein [Algoriphagus sp. CAU 1675]MDF2157081.1 thioredoxin family protein [Algoriphagus sp. CAU 1675]
MIELLFFSGKTCGVCQVLKPKLLPAVQEEFPEVNVRVIDVEEEAELAGQSMVFTLPVVIIKFDGQEMHRFARSFSVYEVLNYLDRLVKMTQ